MSESEHTIEIEYFYATFSAYAYIGSAMFMEIARAKGAKIIHRPFDWRPVITAAGPASAPGPINGLTDARRAYFSGREIIRWAEYRGVAIIDDRPTRHDNPLALSSGLVIAAVEAGHSVDALVHALFQSHWRDDSDLADEATLAKLTESAGLDPAPLLAAALTPAIQAIYEANTAEAITRSVFGSPTYFVGGDMFYGQDHLELVERALEAPFAGDWPPA